MSQSSKEYQSVNSKISRSRPSKIRRFLKVLSASINREYRSLRYALTLARQILRHRTSKGFITLITYFDGKLTNYAHNPNTHNFSDLAPIDNADDKKLYTGMLLWGIKNPSVTNIAITGPYGSGKSSIIRTFQRHHPEFRGVNISLASFDEVKDDKGEWRSKVELSVIQQLIYHERSKDLPDSRFVKIKSIKWYTRVFGTLFLFIFAFSFIYVTQPEYFKRFKFIDDGLKEYLDLGFLVYLTLGSIYLLYRLYRTIRNMRFTKLSVVSAGAEFSEGETRSIFNKHLDEIIYFFEATRTRIIIIEDLDRFNDPEIFTKLREINILINNSRQIKQKVSFIYAVRDNIFTKNNRTKFFDLLIPVIPIISVSNAGDALASRLEKLIPAEKMKRELLRTVTLYIQDMRMLLNIINEFSLYVKQLSTDLDPQKLLALIIFKNLHPKDFAGLHRGKGMIIRVLDKKKEYVVEQKNLIDQQVIELQGKIRDLESLKITDVEELRALYVYKALSALPIQAQLLFNGENRLSEFVKKQAFEFWRLGGALTASAYNSGYQSFQPINYTYSFSKAEKEVNANHTYLERLGAIELYTQDGIAKAKEQIAERTQRRAILSGQSLKEIIHDGGELTYTEKEKIPPVLEYLMSNGYIDEYYHPYISYFIEGALKQADMDFVMSVLNRKPLANDYDLSNIDIIVRDWISYGQYSSPAVLNFNLLEWLLKQDNRQQEISMILAMVKKNSDIQFVDGFINREKEIDTFVAQLAKAWPQIWEYLHEDSFYGDIILASYASLFIQHLPIETIENDINFNGKFAEFLTYNSDVYQIDRLVKSQAKLSFVLNGLKVLLVEMSVLTELPETMKEVYKQNLYVVNEANVQFVLEKFGGYDPFPEELWKTENFGSILASRAESLIKYLDEEIPKYLEIASNIPSNINESEETILRLLGYEILEQEKVEEFLNPQSATITDLDPVPDRYITYLLKSDKVAVNWKNVLTYFDKMEELEDVLTDYLNNTAHLSALIAEPYPVETETPDGAIPFSQDILYRNDLLVDTYKRLVDHLNPNLDSLEVEKLNREKIHYLVDEKLTYTASYFVAIEEHHPLELLFYIIKNFDEFLAGFSELSISDATLIDLIQSVSLLDEQKARLVEVILTNLVIERNELGKILIGFLSKYEQWPNSIQYKNVLPIFEIPMETQNRIKAITPIFSHLDKETFLNIENSFENPYDKVSVNDTTQRSFPKFGGLGHYLESVKSLLPSRIGKVKENKNNITIYYKTAN